MKPKPLVVFTTVPTRAVARKITKVLLAKKLAASVQVSGKIKSEYWWKGRRRKADEYVCSIRTTSRNYASVERAVVAAHPYEVPELFAVEISQGYAPFLHWMKAGGQ